MKEFKNILFPVDLSGSSEKIVPYLQTVANKFESQLHLLFVARVFNHFTSIYVPQSSINQIGKEILEGAEKKLQEFMDNHFKNYPDTKPQVIAGDASEEILNSIQSQGIDLIIMGTHGRKGLDKVLFGSVAERVVKTAKHLILIE